MGHGKRTLWPDGPSVLHHLEHVTIRPHQDFRGFAGTVISGTIRKGEEVVALPSMRGSRVKEIHTHEGALDEAYESQAVVFTLEDEIDVSRGEMLVRTHNVPKVNNRLEAILCWMDESKGLSTTTTTSSSTERASCASSSTGSTPTRSTAKRRRRSR